MSAKDFCIKEQYSFDELREIMCFLRSQEGCPWDREQTHESIKGSLVEEAWETVDAIESGKPERIMDELGDVLLQVVFHAQMASEAGHFTLDDVIANLCRKLISRHSHLFGNDKASTPEEVLLTWEANKQKEKGLKTETETLNEVPGSLPALSRAYKVQKKAANCGFDWPDVTGALNKVGEEYEEVKDAILDEDLSPRADLSRRKVEEEAGDLLFAIVNTLRHLKLDPEIALRRATEKFIRRFAAVEAKAETNGKQLKNMSLEEMDSIWDQVKETEEK